MDCKRDRYVVFTGCKTNSKTVTYLSKYCHSCVLQIVGNMESCDSSRTKQVAGHKCFWQDTDFDRNSVPSFSSNQDMVSHEKDSEVVRNPNEEPESRAVHSESDQESDFEIADYDSNEEKDDQPESEFGVEALDPRSEIESKLVDWSAGHNISQRALSELLQVLAQRGLGEPIDRQSDRVSRQSAISLSATSLSATSPSGPQCTCETRFKMILDLLEKNGETLRLHGEILNRLLKQRGPQNVQLPEPPVGTLFPLKTNEDVLSMNEKLRDSVFMSGVVSLTPLFTLEMYLYCILGGKQSG